MRILPLILTVSLMAFAGACSADANSSEEPLTAQAQQQEVDDAWSAKLVEAGVQDADVTAVQQQAATDCQLSDEASWIVALGLTPRAIDSKATEVGIDILCPEVRPYFEAAAARIQDSGDAKVVACALGKDDLDMAELAKLEMVC